MLNLLMYVFALLSLFFLVMLLRGPSIWDRLLFFNLFSVVMILAMIVFAIIKQIDYLLDIAIVYALLSFVSIIFISRFIRRKGEI